MKLCVLVLYDHGPMCTLLTAERSSTSFLLWSSLKLITDFLFFMRLTTTYYRPLCGALGQGRMCHLRGSSPTPLIWLSTSADQLKAIGCFLLALLESIVSCAYVEVQSPDPVSSYRSGASSKVCCYSSIVVGCWWRCSYDALKYTWRESMFQRRLTTMPWVEVFGHATLKALVLCLCFWVSFCFYNCYSNLTRMYQNYSERKKQNIRPLENQIWLSQTAFFMM
jgi:hypothetical protein